MCFPRNGFVVQWGSWWTRTWELLCGLKRIRIFVAWEEEGGTQPHNGSNPGIPFYRRAMEAYRTEGTEDVEAELGLDSSCVLMGVLDSVVTDQVVSLWQKGDPAAVRRGEGLGCLLEADAERTARLHTCPWIHVVLGP